MRRAYDALGIAVPTTTQPGLLPAQGVGRGVRMATPGMQAQPGAMANVRLTQREAPGTIGHLDFNILISLQLRLVMLKIYHLRS